MEKLWRKAYHICMDIIDKLIIMNTEQSRRNGQQITLMLEQVHDEYERLYSKKAKPELVLYHRDLLSYLIKTYGH